MLSRQVYHLQCDFFESPIAIKLNVHDHYVRIAAPYHELIHLHHQLLNHAKVEVSNVYGVPLFTISGEPNDENLWHVHQKGHRSFNVSFSRSAHFLATSKDGHPAVMHFNLLEDAEPSTLEIQMMGAALANCYFQQKYASMPHAMLN